MAPAAPPDAAAPCGKKIDHVARAVGQALAPHGFKRKGRRLVAERGSGDERHRCMLQLESGKWNSGSWGTFHVTLGVVYPALIPLKAREAGWDWMLRHLDDPDIGFAQAKERLGCLQSALPEGDALARPPHSDEYEIGRQTDLDALAAQVAQAALRLGLPWFDAFGRLRALADFEGSLLECDVAHRIMAAVLLGDVARAQQVLSERRERYAHGTNAAFRQWLTDLGLDPSVLAAGPRPPSPAEQQREAGLQAAEQQALQEAEALRAAPDAGTPAALAATWVAEYRAAWRRHPKPLADLQSGPAIVALEPAAREQVLLALLQQLVDAETALAPSARLGRPSTDFELDDWIEPLLQALLATLDRPAGDTLLGVLAAMQALLSRRDRELMLCSLPWGFAALAKWLCGPAGAPHRARLQPAIGAWLQALAATTLDDWHALEAQIAAEDEKTRDPSHPMHAYWEERRAEQAERAEVEPVVSPQEMDRRLAGYPEQQLVAADKQGVRLLRRELLRDPASGALRVHWDSDDWGAPAQNAWDAADDGLRTALTPVLQGWLEGLEPKPPARWLRTLDHQIAALPAPLAGPWRTWVLDRLAAFPATDGHTEWATTTMRPGVGARLGEASDDLLKGLLWWAWRDRGIPDAALAPVLAAVVDAALHRLPGAGARAPTVAALGLRMQAGLGVDVGARAAAKGAPKSLKQAVAQALAQPLSRA